MNERLRRSNYLKKKNPDIVVTTEYSGWDGYWERLSTQAAGRNLPDVIQMDFQYLNEYVSRDLLLGLNEFINSGELNFDDVDDLYLDGGKVDNELYAVNLGANSLAFAYDPVMFEEAGVAELEPGYTWDDYLAAIRKINSELDGVYAAGLGDLHSFKHYLRQHDLWLYNEEHTGLGYDDDQYFIDFFSMYKALLDEGVAAGPGIVADIQGMEDELIVHGEASTLLLHSNQIVELHHAANRPVKLSMYPSMSGGTEAHFLKPSMFFSATEHTNHSEEAIRFIDFFTNDLEANEILNAERGVPISEKVRGHIYDDLDEYEQMQFDYIELIEEHSTPIHPPEPSGTGEINDAFERLMQELQYDMITVEEFAERFRQEVDNVLAN